MRTCFRPRGLGRSIRCAVLGLWLLGDAAPRAVAAPIGPDPASDRTSSPRAASRPGVASLVVHAPRDCTSRDDVIARVAGRAPSIRFVGRTAGLPAFRVEIQTEGPGHVRATLLVTRAGRSRTDRRLSAASCDEAADALALVIALIIAPASVSPSPSAAAAPARSDEATPPQRPQDAPAGSVGPAAPPREAPAIPAVPSPRALAAPTAPAALTPREAAPANAGARAPVPLPTDQVADQTARVEAAAKNARLPARHRLEGGAAFRGTTGPAPRWLAGVALFAAWRIERPSIWSPLVTLVVAHQTRDGWVTPDGTGDFTLDAVSLNVCPARLGVSVLSLHLCAGALAGRLTARGSQTFDPRVATRPFASAGGAAILTVALLRRVEVTASFEPAAALVRDRFSFDPNVFHRVPLASLSFGAGAALIFP